MPTAQECLERAQELDHRAEHTGPRDAQALRNAADQWRRLADQHLYSVQKVRDAAR